MYLQEVIDLVESDSSIDEDDIEDDVFVDNVRSTKTQRLSTYIKLF